MTTERERIIKRYLKIADHEYIRERLVLAREDKGWTPAIAAENLNYKYIPTVSAMERGKRRISADFLIRAALAYGVSLKWLLTGE